MKKFLSCAIFIFLILFYYESIVIGYDKNFWIIKPGENVGKITRNSSENDLIKIFGKENVKQENIVIGEGETTGCTIIYKDSKNELKILWEKAYTPPIKKIIIMKKNTDWRTIDNITIGTKLEELLNLNKKDFIFYGFDWDYSGSVKSWNGGNLNKNYQIGDKFSLQLKYNNKVSLDDLKSVTGDIEVNTNNLVLKKLGLEVESFAIIFGINSITTAKIVSKDGLRIRKEPTTNAEIIIAIPYDEKIEIIEKSNNEETVNGKKGKWVKIKWNASTGWVFDAYIEYQ